MVQLLKGNQCRRKKSRDGHAAGEARDQCLMGGAGLIRFFQDESTGVKVGPIVTIMLTVLLIVMTILGLTGVFNILFNVSTPTST